MHAQHKLIRQTVKTRVAEVVPNTVPVFTRRYVDAEDLEELVTIYLSQGEIEQGLGWNTSFTRANLHIVLYCNCDDGIDGNSDDTLDDRADLIVTHLAGTPDLGGLVRGFLYSGFEYPVDDERGFSQLVLTYSLQY